MAEDPYAKISIAVKALWRGAHRTIVEMATKVADDNQLEGAARETFMDKALGPSTIYVGSRGGPAYPVVIDHRPGKLRE